MRFTLLTFIALIFFLVPEFSHATHLQGISMRYECLGGCNYRIYHTSHWDCASALTPPAGTVPPAPLGVAITGAPGCVGPTSVGGWVLLSYTDITPVCPGFLTQCDGPTFPFPGTMEAIFYKDYDFCSVTCSSYTATWSTCCRYTNSSHVNASLASIYGELDIDLSTTPCNNSPQFYSGPAPYLCAGNTGKINFGAFDPDGDSLVYRFADCLDANGVPMAYNPGFSKTAPLGPNWNVTLDANTGELTATPNPGPMLAVSMCVEVEEYRNGVLIGTVSRDLQLTILNCGQTNAIPDFGAGIFAPTGATNNPQNNLVACVGSQVGFSLIVSDPDPFDVVNLTSNIQHIFPGATVVAPNNGNGPTVTATVSFTPTAAGVYGIYFSATDSACPYPHTTIQNIRVEVLSTCITGTVVDAGCGTNNGSITTMVNLGFPPFTYLWSNGATTANITGLAPGSYSVTVTDANSATFSQTFFVNASNISVNATLTDPTCANQSGGSIQTAAAGGTAPLTYLWNTGATTSDITGLAAGGYSVTVTDATGCSRHEAFILQAPDSCFNIIEGYVYDDANQNCIQDAGENGLSYVHVDIQPGGAIFTDANGYYQFRAGLGTSVVAVTPTLYRTPFCPASGIDSVSFTTLKNTATLNFALDYQSVQDLRAGLYAGPARRGQNKISNLAVHNDGSVTMNPVLTWTHDPIFTFTSGVPAPTSYDPLTHTAIWNFTNLHPGGQVNVFANAWVDTAQAIGTPWSESLSVAPVAGDFTPANNTASVSDTIRAAYDPNDKQVSPLGIRAPGYILASENQMQYTVRFQNTGNDTAFYVVIRDTIDTDLDISSYQPGTESHPYSLFVENDEVLVFTFANILLPDSGTNLVGSQGHVSFYLNHKGALSAGTVIENSAAIYFDFNAPIITNTVTNTIYTQPVVGLGNDTTICEGQFLTGNIIAAGMPPYDFTWSTGDIDPGNFAGMSQTTVQSSGIYSVNVTDAFGFTTTDMVDVTAAPLPDATFGLVQNNLNISLNNTSTDNSSWNWDFGDGNTDSGLPMASHTYAANGTYTVTLIASNDCGSDTSTQVIDFTVGLDVTENGMQVGIQPNPFSSSTFVSFDNPSQHEFSIFLYDLQGRQVREYETIGEQVEILRENLPGGIYLLEVRGDAVYYGRVVVE